MFRISIKKNDKVRSLHYLSCSKLFAITINNSDNNIKSGDNVALTCGHPSELSNPCRILPKKYNKNPNAFNA